MNTILVPTDFSEYTPGAIEFAAQIARKTGNPIVLQHNIEDLINWDHLSPSERLNHPETLAKTVVAEKKLNALRQAGALDGLTVDTVITFGATYEEVISKAKSLHATMIIIGSHGNEKSGKYFIGSNTQKVMRAAPCPVVTVKKEFMNMLVKKILFPISLEDDIKVPFEKVLALAQTLNAAVNVLFVNTPTHFKDSGSMESEMKSFVLRYPEYNIISSFYNHFDIERGIVDFAERTKPDMIAMVTHDRINSPRYLMGVTESISFHSSIPVFSMSMRMFQPVLR